MQLGDFADNATIVIHFTTHEESGLLIAPSAAFVETDFRVYKNGSATEKTSANGITVVSPFDAVVGKHVVTIDTSNDTGDAGFWAAGNDYRVEINSAKTVDGHLQTGVEIGSFSLENRYMRGTAGANTVVPPTVAEFEARTLPMEDLTDIYTWVEETSEKVTVILFDTDTTIPGLIDSISGLVLAPSPTVERVLGDTDAIRFSWPVDGATITGEVSKAGGTYAAVTGAISQRTDESGVYWYQLAYNAADRQLGSVRYKFTDGTSTRYVNLLVNPASAEVDLDPILTVLGTPVGASVSVDIAAVKSDTTSILAKLTAAFSTLVTNLTAMITGSGGTAKYTVTALENAPAGGGGGSTTISDEDIQEIVAGVTAVAPRICDSSAGTFRMRAGDTWIQDFTVVTTGADRFIVAVKNNAADDDTAAILLIDSVDGLERINGAVPASAGDASIAAGAATITATVASNITLMIVPGKYVVTVKKLDVGSDVTAISTASLTVFAPGISEIST